MAWRAGFSWLVSLAATRRARRRSWPDHGDVGTAFGLDASVDAIDPAVEGRSVPARRRPWADRLNRRSSL
jgi:hypothetical protein